MQTSRHLNKVLKSHERVKELRRRDDLEESITRRWIDVNAIIFVTYPKLCISTADNKKDRIQQSMERIALHRVGQAN